MRKCWRQREQGCRQCTTPARSGCPGRYAAGTGRGVSDESGAAPCTHRPLAIGDKDECWCSLSGVEMSLFVCHPSYSYYTLAGLPLLLLLLLVVFVKSREAPSSWWV